MYVRLHKQVLWSTKVTDAPNIAHLQFIKFLRQETYWILFLGHPTPEVSTQRARWFAEVSKRCLLMTPSALLCWFLADVRHQRRHRWWDGERNYVWVQIVLAHYFGSVCLCILSWGCGIIAEWISSNDSVTPAHSQPLADKAQHDRI